MVAEDLKDCKKHFMSVWFVIKEGSRAYSCFSICDTLCCISKVTSPIRLAAD